jgi:hypothetical protein
MTVAAVATTPKTTPSTEPQPQPQYFPRFVDFEQHIDMGDFAKAKTNGRLDVNPGIGVNIEPTWVKVEGTIMGQPVNETKVGKVDAIERELMAGIKAAIEGANLIGRSSTLEDVKLAPPTPNDAMRFYFQGVQGEGRYADILQSDPQPGDEALVAAFEAYGHYVFPEDKK